MNRKEIIAMQTRFGMTEGKDFRIIEYPNAYEKMIEMCEIMSEITGKSKENYLSMIKEDLDNLDKDEPRSCFVAYLKGDRDKALIEGGANCNNSLDDDFPDFDANY